MCCLFIENDSFCHKFKSELRSLLQKRTRNLMADRSQRITGQNWHCRRQFFAIFVVTVKTKTLFSESKADAEGIMKHLDTGTGLDRCTSRQLHVQS